MKLWLLFLLAVLPACISSPNAPPRVRYFSVDPADYGALAVEASATSNSIPIRLRSVSAASHLDKRMVWRNSDVEYGFYEDRRWTENPALYLERALRRELFESGQFQRSNAPNVRTLEIDLLGFEEVVHPQREARVAVAFTFTGASIVERTVEARSRIESDSPDLTARAMAQALADCVKEVVDTVRTSL